MNILKPKGIVAKWILVLVLLIFLALGSFGYLDMARDVLHSESFTFSAGSFKISLYDILRAVIFISIVFWLAAIVSDIAEKRINQLTRIKPTNKSLILKVFHITIYVLAFLLTLDIVGLDLTTLTVFSGALGIGIGFGLQKISSNFISGIILLLEKSVEQDDLIELADGTLGFIKRASFRYTLVETFDGKEILVPNEEFITSRVINLTFTNSTGRIEIPIGVSYKSDLDKVHEIILESALEHPRCLSEPAPKCFLRSFGDSSVNFILHFWITDITLGRAEPHSEVMFTIWRKFKENNIEIPFPQRELHIKTSDTIQV